MIHKLKPFLDGMCHLYLTRLDLFATLHPIIEFAPARSIVVFNYAGTDAFVSEKLYIQTQKSLEFL
jgi:hypothetical protein